MNTLIIDQPDVPGWQAALASCARAIRPRVRSAERISEPEWNHHIQEIAEQVTDLDQTLRQLLFDSLTTWSVGLALLDECDDASDDALAEVAERLYQEVIRQGNRDYALRELLAERLHEAATQIVPF